MDRATNLVEVIQADRDAAWPFVPRNSIAGTDREGFFAGRYDEAQAVQAFARHRLQSLLAPASFEDVAYSAYADHVDTAEAIQDFARVALQADRLDQREEG